MAVILFHIESSLESLVCVAHSHFYNQSCVYYCLRHTFCVILMQVSACSKVDLILGVLEWSTGSRWPGLTGNKQIREC